jgi:hypothetical protein
MIETEKTYPPEVAKVRDVWLAEIERIKAKYSAGSDATATMAVRLNPNSPYEMDRLDREYRAEIDPILKLLGDLEGYAILHYHVMAG